MSEIPNDTSPEYPFGFEPDLYVSPENCLVAASHPGFIGLGAAVESKGELNYDKLREEMARSGINVGILVLERKDGVKDYFSVYLDAAQAEISVLPEHFERATNIVTNNEAFTHLDKQQKEREIINLAFTLASSPSDAVLFRVTDEGSELMTYPTDGEVVDDKK
ncbi:MAG TPA: hypothetical protein VI336_03155 [Candidatus Saccharimonadales bacterium]|nr:hypothetical protein [Candidatus Saccharimonadales bacterium]